MHTLLHLTIIAASLASPSGSSSMSRMMPPIKPVKAVALASTRPSLDNPDPNSPAARAERIKADYQAILDQRAALLQQLATIDKTLSDLKGVLNLSPVTPPVIPPVNPPVNPPVTPASEIANKVKQLVAENVPVFPGRQKDALALSTVFSSISSQASQAVALNPVPDNLKQYTTPEGIANATGTASGPALGADVAKWQPFFAKLIDYVDSLNLEDAKAHIPVWDQIAEGLKLVPADTSAGAVQQHSH